MPNHLLDTVEGKRLANREDWLRWGPYLSERQWGTVREDYSADGNAWTYFPFEHAASRVYRWGEDGIAGWTDDRLRWCLSLALWNGKDPILKERLFGLTNAQGNHGEDVKELYYYLDGTPTHSYMRMLYKYPQAEFPYAALIAENARSGPRSAGIRTARHRHLRRQPLLRRHGRICQGGARRHPDPHHVSTTAARTRPICTCCRSSGRATPGIWRPGIPEPEAASGGWRRARMPQPHAGTPAGYRHEAPSGCSAATKPTRSCCIGSAAAGPFKDGINDFVVKGDASAVDRRRRHQMRRAREADRSGGGTPGDPPALASRRNCGDPFADHDGRCSARIAEADEFYAALQCNIADPDARLVQRQALAGMLWSKQFYRYDVRRWLEGDPLQPEPPPER